MEIVTGGDRDGVLNNRYEDTTVQTSTTQDAAHLFPLGIMVGVSSVSLRREYLCGSSPTLCQYQDAAKEVSVMKVSVM